MSIHTKSIVALAVALSLVMAQTAVAGEKFVPEAADVWAARTTLMAQVGGDGGLGREAIVSNMVRACDGLQGEQMKNEYGKVPKWALGYQLVICSAYNGFDHRFGSSQKPCKTLKLGDKYFKDMDAAETPANVVEAANALNTTVGLIQQSDACS